MSLKLRLLLLPLLALGACDGLPFGLDGEEVAGTYRLVEVDGSPLPALLPAGDPCPARVEEGEMYLTPAEGLRRSFYGWSVRGEPTCPAPGEPARLVPVEGDGGGWTVGGDGVRFDASARDGRAYWGRVDARGGRVRIALQKPGGARYTFERVRRPGDPTGLLWIAARDEAGEMVKGTQLEIRTPDGLVQRAALAYDQPFGTSGPPGSWTVRVTPPAGYEVPPTQPNPAPAQVAAGQHTDLVVRLRRTATPE